MTKSVNPEMVNDEYSSEEVFETKFLFNVTETKEVSRDGVNYGIIEGYASTYNNIDRVNDKVMPGAFTKSLKRYASDDRKIRMFYQHDSREVIGGFPSRLMSEDEKGLKVVGEVNLDVQRGREVYALAKQGVLSDFSIGYTVKDFNINKGVRELREIDLWEISIVAEPANPLAKVTEVKNAVGLAEVKESLTSKREVERFLRDLGLSRSAAVYFSSLLDDGKLQSENNTKSLRDVEDEVGDDGGTQLSTDAENRLAVALLELRDELRAMLGDA